MTAHEIAIVHVVLDADAASLRTRITADNEDTQAARWRLDHVERYIVARSWLLDAADLVVDTAHASPDDIARTILGSVAR